MDPRYPHAARGIGFMLLAVSTFACLDSTSKYLGQHYPAPAVVWLRSVLQTLVMMAIFAPRMGMGLVRTSSLGGRATLSSDRPTPGSSLRSVGRLTVPDALRHHPGCTGDTPGTVPTRRTP